MYSVVDNQSPLQVAYKYREGRNGLFWGIAIPAFLAFVNAIRNISLYNDIKTKSPDTFESNKSELRYVLILSILLLSVLVVGFIFSFSYFTKTKESYMKSLMSFSVVLALSIGVSVWIQQITGKIENEKIKDAVHDTSLIVLLSISLVFTFGCMYADYKMSQTGAYLDRN